jgi:hypothetical protein
LSRLDGARGARRGALLAALLAAAPSDAARRGAEAVLGETDPEVLTELHAALCVEPPLHRDPEAFERLTRAAAGGSLGALLALDGAGAFPPGSRDAFAEALLRDPGDALLDLRAAAAGRIASRDWILARLRKEYPASKSDERLTRSLSHLTGELWRRSSRIERSEIADTLSAGDNAPDDARIRRPGGRVLFLTDLARLFAATGQLDLVAPQGLWFETRRADQVLFPYRLSFERGSPFPAREHLLDALVP